MTMTTGNLARHRRAARLASLASAALLGLAAGIAVAAPAPVVPAASISAAVADPGRPEADKARDANRKPAETVAFAGVKPGDLVGELFPGGGYFTRILSKVAGPSGAIYAYAPPNPPDAPPGARDFAAAAQSIAADPAYANVHVVQTAPTNIAFPVPLDVVWTSQNYHDFHNVPGVDVGTFDRQIFAALKPGGIFFVLDHAAEPGSADRDTKTLHRIDPDAVKREVLAAGFVFVGASDLLHRSDDPHTASVFDPLIRGKTDQFILKFRKPPTSK
jgi:predicted methyltransferase